MNTFRSRRVLQAFTLVELLVVVAALVLLGSITLSATLASRTSSQAEICVANVGRLILAWQMYALDSKGVVPGNGDEGNQHENEWCNGVLSYGPNNPDNTNYLNFTYHNTAAGYKGGQLGAYLSHNPELFKCPSDAVMVEEGGQKLPRCRSVSMNSYVDGATTKTMGWNANTWQGTLANMMQTTSQFVNPGPDSIWVFRDERPDSINAGFFPTDISDANGVNMPASFHFGGSAAAFADGHAEIHLWKTAPYRRQDVNAPGWTLSWAGASFPNNVDREWLQLHSAQFGPGFQVIP